MCRTISICRTTLLTYTRALVLLGISGTSGYPKAAIVSDLVMLNFMLGAEISQEVPDKSWCFLLHPGNVICLLRQIMKVQKVITNKKQRMVEQV